ncbi:formate/nitrite transporter family protein [Terrisporobacter sp.]
MNQETIDLLAHKAEVKVETLNESKLKYIVSSMFAGMFIGLGCILIFTIGGMFYSSHFAGTNLLVGISFSFALSMIILLGYELFTSNTMIMVVGALSKATSKKDACRVLLYSYVGNLLGAILVSILFIGTGMGASGASIEYFVVAATHKVETGALQLLCQGILCNILVCASVLGAYKTKDEAGRILVVFLCLFAFVTSGFQHCIANMTTLITCLLTPFANSITLGAVVSHLFFVTIGNIIGGGLFLGAGTYFMSKKKENKITSAATKVS